MLLHHLLALLLFMHGLLHLIGFADSMGFILLGQKSFKVATRSRQAIAGMCWLVAGLLFIVTSLLFYTKWDFYWIMLFPAFIFSQVLIVMNWPLDKYGTIVNLIVLVVIMVATGSYSFDQKVGREIKSLEKEAQYRHRDTITQGRIDRLPPHVKRWMIKSGVVGKKEPSLVHVVQKGAMRQKQNGIWSEFHAQQYFSLNPPGFVWNADIQMNEALEVKGRDKLENGHGNMLIKAESLFPIANARGKEIDQGTFIRFMAEMSWFPQAALKNYISWKDIDQNRSQAFITYGNTSVAGVFTFNDNGLPILFEAKRYGDFNGKYSLETWSVKTTNFKVFQGITVGCTSEVTWKLSSGDFTWLKLEVTQLDYGY